MTNPNHRDSIQQNRHSDEHTCLQQKLPKSVLILCQRCVYIKIQFHRLSFVYIFAPRLVMRQFSSNRLMIHLLDLTRDRPCLPVANGTEINFTQADAFRGGSAYEDFVRDIELVTRNGFLKTKSFRLGLGKERIGIVT